MHFKELSMSQNNATYHIIYHGILHHNMLYVPTIGHTYIRTYVYVVCKKSGGKDVVILLS